MSRLRELLSIEGLTLLGVLAGLVVVEAALRVAGDRLSGDVAHLERIEEIVETLDRSSALKVLFVGNSLIGEGLDADALSGGLTDAMGRSVEVAVVRPDAGAPLEWYYLLDRHVFLPDRRPDLLVVPFGPGHLYDREGREATLRLAAHHVATSTIPELLAEDLQGFEARAQFFIARASRAFALRDRVQPRVLDMLIPDYQSLAPLILLAPEADTDRQVGDTPAVGRTRSTDQIERLARRADEAGLPVLYLAMPQGTPWTPGDRVRGIVEGSWPGLLDFRRALDLAPERFPDGEHMDSEGRERFTERLSAEMLPTVRELSEGSGG